MPEVKDNSKRSLAIIGGGLAGMAAAAIAVEHGFEVEIFERNKRLGGRAASFYDGRQGKMVDLCQHVSMACCTNLSDFCRRTETADCFTREKRLHFFGPAGDQYDFAASRLLPAPLHLAPSMLGLGYLSLSERLSIARAVRRLVSQPADDNRNVADWLKEQGQTDRAVELFWSVVLISALSETLDRTSLAAARKVFLDGMLGAREAYEMELPDRPLSEILDDRAGKWLSENGATVHRATKVNRIEGDKDGASSLLMADGSTRPIDFVIAAVPWHRIRRLLSPELVEAIPSLDGVKDLHPAAITAVHLWFDRPICPLPHAVLTGKTSQWAFFKGEYCQIVISASDDLVARSREELVETVRDELASVWPATGDANLLRSTVFTQPASVFSPRPGVDQLRPTQETPIKNLFLAGDWTATGWPATMESAVRSGYLAVESILRSMGKDEQLVVPDLPRGRLAEWVFLCSGCHWFQRGL